MKYSEPGEMITNTPNGRLGARTDDPMTVVVSAQWYNGNMMNIFKRVHVRTHENCNTHTRDLSSSVFEITAVFISYVDLTTDIT